MRLRTSQVDTPTCAAILFFAGLLCILSAYGKHLLETTMTRLLQACSRDVAQRSRNEFVPHNWTSHAHIRKDSTFTNDVSSILVYVIGPLRHCKNNRCCKANNLNRSKAISSSPTSVSLSHTNKIRTPPTVGYRFSAFWLRSSVVSVLLSLISETLGIARLQD